eukprot:2567112-Rhodomonas_salina.1
METEGGRCEDGGSGGTKSESGNVPLPAHERIRRCPVLTRVMPLLGNAPVCLKPGEWRDNNKVSKTLADLLLHSMDNKDMKARRDAEKERQDGCAKFLRCRGRERGRFRRGGGGDAQCDGGGRQGREVSVFCRRGPAVEKRVSQAHDGALPPGRTPLSSLVQISYDQSRPREVMPPILYSASHGKGNSPVPPLSHWPGGSQGMERDYFDYGECDDDAGLDDLEQVRNQSQ